MAELPQVDWHIAEGDWNTSTLQEWFDGLEESLTRDAKTAGLLQHGSLVGGVREFLVKRVLQTLLPPAAHIGMGRVIDAKGGMSKQIDIVIYDSRLPVFELDGGIGLYPIEGVLATIEIKSNLNKRELWNALDNCNSVLSLTLGLTDGDRLNECTEDFLKNGLDLIDAVHRTHFLYMPATYVFALRGMQSKTLAVRVNEWFKEKNEPASPSPHLPRVVTCHRAVGFLRDGYMQIIPTAEVLEEAKSKVGEDARLLMSVCKTRRRFGWLALHLLYTVSSRLGAVNAKLNERRLVEHYLASTGMSYFEQDLEGTDLRHIWWQPPDPQTL